MPVGRTPGRRVAAVCAAALALPLFLAACGDSDESGSTSASTGASTGAAPAATTEAPKEAQEVTLQLDWTPNTNHTGFYVADKKGYYEDAGVKLKILPYSDAGADTIVGAGKANCGITSQDNLPVASAAGTNEVSVMPILQHQANVLIVKDDSKYQAPKDLSGAKYGGFGLPFEQPLVDAMIKHDGGTGDVKNVILNTGAYEAVYNGKVDTSLSFKTWEMIEADERGIKLRTFYPNDYGVPDTYNVLLACNGDWLKDNPELAKAFVSATAKGFTDAMTDPQGSAQILIDANPGVFSNEKMVFTSADLLAKDYYPDPDGTFGCQTDARWQEYPKWLYEQGILKDESGKPLTAEPDYASFYSNDYAPDDCAGGAA
jgi:ABC-type nitrate/sulfonate/bicarbonate transport system substrate-binding protein